MMKRVALGLILALFLIGLCIPPAFAQEGSTGGRDEQFEQQVYQKLE